MANRFPASRWISFIRRYGPVPTNDNMYDEAIQRTLRKLDIPPIVLPSNHLDLLLQNFRGQQPRSIILTGTAGDGKTYHCREVYEALGGDVDQWHEGGMIQRLTIDERELVVAKDLSELPEPLSGEFVLQLAKDVLSASHESVYLIAANHGQLLEKLDASIESQHVRQLKELVEDAMVTGAQPEEAPLSLYDMSRTSALNLVSEVMNRLLLHPAWEGCRTCPLLDALPRCPIQENRGRLIGEEDAPALLKVRLNELIELSELNDVHFPVRQLLALVANMILGHPEATDGLMTCRTAASILDRELHDRASIFGNVFGENLRRRCERTEPFAKLRRFGIGDETNNGIDSILVYGRDDHTLERRFTDLMGCDPIYGATPTYLALQTAYLEGTDDTTIKAFLDRLRQARQRLFFVIPQDTDADPLRWDLTVFRFAGDFLETAHRLSRERKPDRVVVARLVRGLNRVFTGALVDDEQQVVLASAGSHSQSRTTHILDDLVSVQRRSGEEVRLRWQDDRVVFSIQLGANVPPIELPLTLLRFEFLSRVAEGALPSSFSRECYEDMLDYKARLYRALQDRQDAEAQHRDEETELVLDFLEVSSDGRVRRESVEVKLP